MSIQLQEIQSIFISQNRLVEGKDYVRAEWLKGDGSAYIDTKVTDLSTSDYIKTIFDDTNNIGANKPRTWGRECNGRLIVGNDNQSTRLSVWGSTSVFNYNNNGAYLYDMYFDLLNNNVIVNNNTSTLALPYEDGLSFVLFARHANSSTVDIINFAKFKSFEIHNQINLTPCQLLRPIPPELDANGIARAAGECGMVDSISGKFYGNVASSGSFTVENLDESGNIEDTRLHQIYTNKLVEGRDYMIGEWLKGGGAIRTINNTTNVSTINLKFKINSFTDGRLFGRDGTYRLLCGTYTNNRFRCWGNNELIFTNVGTDVDFTFDIVKRKAILNGVEKSQTYAAKAGEYLLLAPGTCTSVASLSIGNIMSLTPCRLLRPIPRNLDAQCKSRVAGECGMIDLISGRFYGNVADSGTFSLAWDEWLKDCSIQFNPEATLEYSTSIPNDYVFYGRMEVAKLTAQYTDFGFMQASNNYIILGESTVYAISDWGTDKWATFVVSYSGGYECSLQLNGVTLTTITSSTPYNEAPHIQLHGIMQINKIEHTFYPNESDPTQSQSEVWKRFVEEDGRQGLGISDLTYKIYAD